MTSDDNMNFVIVVLGLIAISVILIINGIKGNNSSKFWNVLDIVGGFLCLSLIIGTFVFIATGNDKNKNKTKIETTL